MAESKGTSEVRIAEQALVAPARCCLKNIGQVGAHNEKGNQKAPGIGNLSIEEQVVERAFGYLGTVSQLLKERFNLDFE